MKTLKIKCVSILVSLCILIISICTAYGQEISTVNDDLDITIPNIEFNGENLNIKLNMEYRGIRDGEHYWILKSIKEKRKDYKDIDQYGFDESEFIEKINEARGEGAPCSVGGLSSVSWDNSLAKAALNHCLDMARNNFFDHTGSEGSHFSERVRETEFSGRAWGENIGAGYSSVESAISGWLNSPGHCKNIMSPYINCVGYAFVLKKGTKWNYYHTMVTGKK